jgi:hypothetical protein
MLIMDLGEPMKRRVLSSVTRGRCYDHDFLQFLTIFGDKIGVFLKTNVMINFIQNLALFSVKKRQFFAKFFGENIFKIITSVPDWAIFRLLGDCSL